MLSIIGSLSFRFLDDFERNVCLSLSNLILQCHVCTSLRGVLGLKSVTHWLLAGSAAFTSFAVDWHQLLTASKRTATPTQKTTACRRKRPLHHYHPPTTLCRLSSRPTQTLPWLSALANDRGRQPLCFRDQLSTLDHSHSAFCTHMKHILRSQSTLLFFNLNQRSGVTPTHSPVQQNPRHHLYVACATLTYKRTLLEGTRNVN